MYKIVPVERQSCSKGTITKNRCKPSKNGLQRSFLAPPARLELTTFRLGGGPSILVRYGGIYRNYSIIQDSGIRTIRFLGGGRSIHLSYRDISQVWLTGGAGLGLQENECPYGVRRKSTRRWCEGRDLNPQGYPHAPQTCASASSATLAYLSCGAVGAVCRTA